MNRQTSFSSSMPVLLLILSILVAPACGGSDSAAVDPAPVGGEVVLSETISSELLPRSVAHYSAGQVATLSNLRLSVDGSTASGSLDYKQLEDEPFALVVHAVTPERWLALHYDATQRLLLVEPSGGGGNVLFSLEGYRLTARGDGGKIEFEFPLETFRMFDIQGAKGTVFAYLVRPPQDGSATLRDVISNVLQAPMDF
jgi:hypothetical protein